MSHQHTLSILVKNQPGVLAKIAQLFYRRGHNIETLTVGKTQVQGVSKMVISVPLEQRVVEHLRRQIENLVDVYHVNLLDHRSCLSAEVCLIRLGVRDDEDRQQIMAHAQPYRPQLREIDPGSMVLEINTNPELIDAFIMAMSQHDVQDVSRTGMTALEAPGCLGHRTHEEATEIDSHSSVQATMSQPSEGGRT